MKAANQATAPVLLCIGHRGAMGHEPENTLRSFRKALELGVLCIELDVYFVDGHLIVIHDDRLERTTSGTGFVMDQSFETLRSLDAGKGERIPTLEEVCVLIDGKAGLNIELKGPGTAGPVAQHIATLINAGWDRKTILVSSFNREELLQIRRLDPELQLGVLSKKALPTDLEFAASLGAVSINSPLRHIDRTFVNNAHAHNLKVFVYTVNEPDDIARMHELGVDGVFTNYPERVLENYTKESGNEFW